MKIIFSISLFVLLTSLNTSEASAFRYKLELLQVLFRHGDRVPAKDEVYKTDPYDPVFYETYGYGQLTKVGMLREYRLGQMLRRVYNSFLGEYKVDEVYGFSTDVDRTKASLQLALAGLYPVTDKRQWNSHVRWAPIPTHYTNAHSNFLETNRYGPCTSHGAIVKKVLRSNEINEKLKKYRPLTETLSNDTLFTTSDPYNLYLLFWNVRCVVGMELPMPKWCHEECYRNLEDITGIVLEALTYTNQLKRLSAGPMLSQFLANIEAENSKRKVYMFAAHDTTVSALTRALNLTAAPRIPDFGSAVIIEKLRGLADNQTYIRLKMWTGVSEHLYAMQLNDCSVFCPLEKFKKIVEPVLLTEEEKKCFMINTEGITNRLLSETENTFSSTTSVHKYYVLAGNDIKSLKYSQDI